MSTRVFGGGLTTVRSAFTSSVVANTCVLSHTQRVRNATMSRPRMLTPVRSALDAANGDLLWHTRIGNITNAPQTFDIDGRQYVLVGVGDTLYAFVMY